MMHTDLGLIADSSNYMDKCLSSNNQECRGWILQYLSIQHNFQSTKANESERHKNFTHDGVL